jgi:hypothetical protein
MKKPAITLLFLIALGSIAFVLFTYAGTHKKNAASIKTPAAHAKEKSAFKKIRAKATEARDFAEDNGYNSSFCFLVDMSVASGKNRFFVYDFAKDTIGKTGLVTHGRCNEDWLEGRRYGNTVGCGCTSLGKYKIGQSYMGRFGLAFKLFGLDTTNDKAYRRYVVLHAHECVPESQIDGEICQSDGCPTVSPGFLKELDPMIKNSGKPVLLWIFE